MSEGEKLTRRGYLHPLFREAQALLDTHMGNFAEIREKTQTSDAWGAVDDESAFSICDIVDREIASLTTELEAALERAVKAEKDLDRLRLIGARFSNAFYNMAQDDRHPPRDQRMMKSLVEEWDAALKTGAPSHE